MNLLNPVWTSLLYLVAAVFFILALRGLSSPRTARRGNLIGALGALIGVVTVFLSAQLDNVPWILGSIAVGTVVAENGSGKLVVARKGAPLLLGLGKDENFAASDASALLQVTRRHRRTR